MLKKQNYLIQFSGIILLFLIAACSVEQNNSGAESANDSTAQVQATNANQVFYSIPSPLQMASLLKSSGAKYNFNNLNPVNNLSKYTSVADMALNLGIYGTDMSFASIFNQPQETMLYLKCVNTLAKNLGVSNAFNENTAARLEANTENRDSLLTIISDAYWEVDAHLKEENRAGVSALIIAGGWIEGLHLAVKIANETNNQSVTTRIAEQKLSLNNLISLLQSYPGDEALSNTIGLLKELKIVFEPITITAGELKASTDPALKTTTITGNGTVSAITKEQLDDITKKIEYIRNAIIK